MPPFFFIILKKGGGRGMSYCHKLMNNIKFRATIIYVFETLKLPLELYLSYLIIHCVDVTAAVLIENPTCRFL